MSWATVAGQYQLNGVVLDTMSGAAVAGVEIYDDVSGKVVLSGSDGIFKLPDAADGTHTLILFREGYTTQTQRVHISSDTVLAMYLRTLSIELSAVEIAARRQELFALRQMQDVDGTAVYAGKKTEVVLLDLVPGNLAANNSRQVYAQVAGLNIHEGSSGGLQLGVGGRGLDPSRTSNFNTRQNNYDISADVLGYPENYYTPPAEAISEIQIIRGASSLQYGSQFGGLIHFKLSEIPDYKKLEVRSNQTMGSYGFFNTFNSIGINRGRWSVNSYFNYKRGEGYRSNSDYQAHNLFVSAAYEVSPKTRIKGEVTYFDYLAQQAGGLTDLQFQEDPRQSTRARNWFDVNWKLYNLRVEHTLKGGSELSVSLFGLDAARRSVGYRGNPVSLNENPITAMDEQDSDGSYLLPRDLITGEFRNVGAEARYLTTYAIGHNDAVLLVGGKYYHAWNTSIQGPGSLGTDADFKSYSEMFPDYHSRSDFDFPNVNAAIFGEHIFYMSDRFSITPGFRVEYIRTAAEGMYRQVLFDNAGNAIANNVLSEERVLKRGLALFGLGLSYKQSTAMTVYANLSQNYRSVTFNDIRVVSPTFIVDPEISDERGYTGDIGLRGRAQNLLSYDVGLYTVLYDDRIGVILDDRANRVRKNIGKAFIAGVESLVDINFARMLKLHEREVKLNLFVNTAVTHSEYIGSDENNVVGKKVEFVPSVNLKSGLQAGYKNLVGSFQLTHLSSQFTDAQNSSVAATGDSRSGIVGEIPAYTVLDCSLSYTFRSLTLEGGVNNVLDRAYFTRRATGYPGPGIIPSDGRSFYVTVSWRY